MDSESLAHTKWNCKYHIVFAPKYRRQIIYGRLRTEIGKILRELCKRKDIDSGSRSMSRSYTHAAVDTAKVQRVERDGVPEGEEQPDDLRQVREPEIQIRESGVLVPRLLCRYRGKEQDCNREIHQEPADRESS